VFAANRQAYTHARPDAPGINHRLKGADEVPLFFQEVPAVHDVGLHVLYAFTGRFASIFTLADEFPAPGLLELLFQLPEPLPRFPFQLFRCLVHRLRHPIGYGA